MNDGWSEVDGALEKTFEFRDFKEALAFVNKVGEVAERLQHHPDICIKDYKKVCISSTTHDQGNCITVKDQELVAAIDTLTLW